MILDIGATRARRCRVSQ